MLDYLLLGITQGITEFLPISSSAHTIFMQKILGLANTGVVVPVVLHLGTTVALLVFFFKDIIELLRNVRLLGLILAVTFITGWIGYFGKDFFEPLFNSVRPAALGLIVTGLLLLISKRFMEEKRNTLNFLDAMILGAAQGLAVIPGISRAGITIIALLFRGIDRETSFTFSFLASIPAVLGAGLLESRGIGIAIQEQFWYLAGGFAISFFVGLSSLMALKIIFLERGKLYYFGYYCIAVAIITLFFAK